MKKLTTFVFILFLGISVITPSFSHAVDSVIDLVPDEAGGQQSPFFKVANNATIDAPRIISAAISGILIIAALMFFFMLVWGGVRWIMSGGEKGNVENARKQITNALIGLAIIFVAWAIIRLLGSIFGVDILKLYIPTLTV